MVRLILNTLTYFGVLFVNYYSASGQFNGSTVGDISDKYETLFTPAGYAFTIWGLIYLMLLAFLVYQWYTYFKEGKELIKNIGLWFIISNICNGLWLFAWLMENFAFSVVLMLFLLYSLIRLVRRLNMEMWDAPLKVIFFVWWPICIYIGWIMVALIANIASFLLKIGWDGYGLTEEWWAIIMLITATIFYIILTFLRNMREASLVGVWAFVAIAVKQWEDHNYIVYSALICSVVLLVVSGYHAWKNRETSPIKKLTKP